MHLQRAGQVLFVTGFQRLGDDKSGLFNTSSSRVWPVHDSVARAGAASLENRHVMDPKALQRPCV